MKSNKNIIIKFSLLSASCLLCLIVNCSSNENNPAEPSDITDTIPGWNLVWSDEFDSPNIDLTKWEHEVNGEGGGNNELQYYTDRVLNSFIDDGKLVIRALKESYTGPDGTREYTSARLRTKYKGDWKYGRFEISAKLPIGQGLWPAIWMLPTDWVYGGWAASGDLASLRPSAMFCATAAIHCRPAFSPFFTTFMRSSASLSSVCAFSISKEMPFKASRLFCSASWASACNLAARAFLTPKSSGMWKPAAIPAPSVWKGSLK